MRCFVGIDLPRSYQDGLGKVVRELKPFLRSRLSWSRPGNWHLTLKFLGEVDEELLPRLTEALGAVRFAPFMLRAGKAGCFPGPVRPRVLWVGLIEGAAECGALASSLESAVAELGYPPEDRGFKPHLTLGRVKDGVKDDWARVCGEAGRFEWPRVEVRDFVLWKSELRPDGPVHTELGRFGGA